MKVGWRDVWIWYALATLLCVVGTYAAYYGPLSSDSWQRWADYTHVIPPLWDTVRALGSALLAIYALYSLEVVSTKDDARGGISVRHLSRLERGLILATALAIGIVALALLPLNFRRTYEGLIRLPHPRIVPAVNDPLSFHQIWAPYFPYSLYVFGLWLGIVFPVLFFLARSMRFDFPQLRLLRSRIDRVEDAEELTKRSVSDYIYSFRQYFYWLKAVANRYVPLFLVVITICLVEQLTPLHCAVLAWAADLGKMALWLLLIPASLVTVFVFLFLFDDGITAAKGELDQLIETLAPHADKDDALDEARRAREDLESESSVSAMLAVTKSGNVGVYFLAILSAGLIGAFLRYHEYWASAFVPITVLHWMHHYLHAFSTQSYLDPVCLEL